MIETSDGHTKDDTKGGTVLKSYTDFLFMWFISNAATMFFVLAIYILQLLLGNFIRYEAGTDSLQFSVAEYPVSQVGDGWSNIFNCYPTPPPAAGQPAPDWDRFCTFSKLKH